MRHWISEGASVELPKVECTAIEVYPRTERVLQLPKAGQQISVLASFSDGTKRDVTSISTYETSSPAVGSVDFDGLVTGHARGQTAVTVRYLDKVQAVNFTAVETVKGFVWKATPEANFVDTLVNHKLKQLKYLPSGSCTDNEFVRRLYLDITGLLPSRGQTQEFLSSHDLKKRSTLVDKLLASEEFARYQAQKRSELMRLSAKRLPDGRAELFSNWIIDSVRNNMPMNEFTRSILTSTGDTHTSAPANYFLAIPSTEERTEMTAQLFMGSRLVPNI